MATFQIDYDNEFDDLYIYRQDKKSEVSLTLADFVVDAQKNGTVVGVEILKATDTLSQMLSREITKNELQNIASAKLNVSVRENGMLISMIMTTDADKKTGELVVPLVVPNFNA